MKYLFGPVNSRRLGRSLGIDLIPFKTCSLNCVYCECGGTTDLTTSIKEYVPTLAVIDELNLYLKDKPGLDVITFSGSGEPTLHSGIGRIIDFLKRDFPEYKVAVLTNSTLFNIASVRKSILNADIIIPSLDAASENIFEKINKPCGSIKAGELIDGLILLRKEFQNIIILEIFIIPGLNDSKEELKLIKSACEKIKPDRIQLNSLDRPGTEKWIKQASFESLLEIQKFFKPLNAEIINNPENRKSNTNFPTKDITDILISMIKRRPSTLEDISSTLSIDQDDLKLILKKLTEKGIIKIENGKRGIFYRI